MKTQVREISYRSFPYLNRLASYCVFGKRQKIMAMELGL